MTELSSLPLESVPLAALRDATRATIFHMLNSRKVLTSPSGYPRDYRGLAYLTNVSLPPCKCPNPTAAVIKSWETDQKPTVLQFLDALKELDRWDVIDDTKHLVGEDVSKFQLGSTNTAVETIAVPEATLSDYPILTIDDVKRNGEGLGPQHYDAFLLYSDDDSDFAETMVGRLEGQHGLKLCLKDRDLVGGITFEHEAIMRLIAERCRRLIIVVSPSFIESPANKFFVTYAQALGIEQRQRKIVPCIYRKVALPLELSYYFVLDYTRSNTLWDFWDKLSQSVKAPLLNTAVSQPSRSEASSVTITEVTPQPFKPADWDCPKKTPRPQQNQPTAIEAPSSQSEQNPPLVSAEEKKKKSKLPALLFSGLQSLPRTKNLKRSWFKKKKEKVKMTST